MNKYLATMPYIMGMSYVKLLSSENPYMSTTDDDDACIVLCFDRNFQTHRIYRELYVVYVYALCGGSVI